MYGYSPPKFSQITTLYLSSALQTYNGCDLALAHLLSPHKPDTPSYELTFTDFFCPFLLFILRCPEQNVWLVFKRSLIKWFLKGILPYHSVIWCHYIKPTRITFTQVVTGRSMHNGKFLFLQRTQRYNHDSHTIHTLIGAHQHLPHQVKISTGQGVESAQTT